MHVREVGGGTASAAPKPTIDAVSTAVDTATKEQQLCRANPVKRVGMQYRSVHTDDSSSGESAYTPPTHPLRKHDSCPRKASNRSRTSRQDRLPQTQTRSERAT